MISGAAVSVSQKGIYPGTKQPGMSNLRRAHLGRRAMNVPMEGLTMDVVGILVLAALFSPVFLIGYIGYRIGKRKS